jgi:hypothetical protein
MGVSMQDLLGWVKRNHTKLNLNAKQKFLNEIIQIKLILEKDLKEGI